MAATPHADWIVTLEAHADDLMRAMQRQLANAAQTLDWLSHRLPSPAATIAHERLKLQGWQSRLAHATRTPLTKARFGVMQLRTRLAAQLPNVAPHQMRLNENTRRMNTSVATLAAKRRQALSALAAQLELLNPQRTLERGYAIVTDAKGKVMRGPKELHPRGIINIRLADGSAAVGIASVQETLE